MFWFQLGNAMGDYLTEHVPINISGFTEYPDAFAFAVTLAFSIALALGAKESSMLNNVFTMTNLAVVLYVIITGSIKANPDNWQIPAEKVPAGHGNGGFAPYGVSGIMKGAAICFYGFIGFDCIATAGEETRNPRRSMPMSIILSLTVVLLAYLGISTVLTMMLPYYEQNLSAPLPYVFERMNLPVAAHIVSYGAIFGLCASLMGSMFPLPRIIYAMSSDGLIFGWMGRINPRFHTPMYGTMFAGTLTGLLAAFLNLSQLVNMMSIGTLMAYTIVAACVLLLRYEVEDENEKLRLPAPFIRNFRSYLWNSERVQAPTRLTSILVTWGVTLYSKSFHIHCKCDLPAHSLTLILFLFCLFLLLAILCILASLVVVGLNDELFELKWWAFSLFAVIGGLMIVTLILISRQPTLKITTAFTVPWVPWLPGLSILANIYLMMMLDVMTWVRFAVWVIIGLSIYFAYGIRKSVVRANVEYKKAVDEKRHEGKMFNSSQEILVPTGQ